MVDGFFQACSLHYLNFTIIPVKAGILKFFIFLESAEDPQIKLEDDSRVSHSQHG
jgi:hypothetical protein